MSLSGLTIERVETFAVPLPSVRSFAVAGGSVTTAGSPAVRVLVAVTGSDGTMGWGEATPLPAWSYETLESITSTIDGYLAPVTVGRPAWDLDGLTLAFDRAINRGFTIGAPFAKAAVDVAVHDLLGRHLGVPVGLLWGRRRLEELALGWIVASEGPGGAAASVAEGIELGYDAFKVKVGLHGEREDLELVTRVRRAAGDRFLWVDANQGYAVDVALRQARRMADLGVAAFEQPLPANDIVGLRRLREGSPVPIALDESLRHPSDLATFVKLDAVDVAIAKVQRTGGLTLSNRFCALAEDAGVRLMGSGLTESDLGLAASLHLFAAHGVDTPVDLNGRQFVTSDYVGATHRRRRGGPGAGPDRARVGRRGRRGRRPRPGPPAAVGAPAGDAPLRAGGRGSRGAPRLEPPPCARPLRGADRSSRSSRHGALPRRGARSPPATARSCPCGSAAVAAPPRCGPPAHRCRAARAPWPAAAPARGPRRGGHARGHGPGRPASP